MSGFDLETFARAEGWNLAGVCPPDFSNEEISRTESWLKSLHGSQNNIQMNYLSRRAAERLDPRKYFAPTQSILSFGLYYFKGWAEGDVKISNYAWDEDYHTLLKTKLEQTAKKLQSRLGEFQYRICVDTAPVLEKTLAVKAGLGWQGKKSLVINPKFGSLFFLGEIFTSISINEFSAKLPVKDHCGTCTRCIDACPTDALTPYQLNASQCISYWTLEHKGDFNSSTPKYSEWVAGCDICQEVCPWNQRLIPLSSDSPLRSVSAADIEAADWPEKIRDSAASYIPEQNWKRNLEFLKNSNM